VILRRDLQVIWRKTTELAPYVRNCRTHTRAQVLQIVASINEFGWTNPILLAENDGLIAGHGRLLAAIERQDPEVPTIVLTGLTDAQRRAYCIVDNQLSLNADWNMELLASEVQGLLDDGFNLDILGFETKGLEKMLSPETFGFGGGASANYKPVFEVSVVCANEADQQAVYDRMTALGYKCKVLTG